LDSRRNFKLSKTNLAGSGIQTAASFWRIYYSGTIAATESYNGTSWTTSPASMSTARAELAGCGLQTSALAFGGQPVTAATEEWNDYGEPNTFENIGQVWYNGTTKALKFTDETFTDAWATGNNMNTARRGVGGAGTQTEALAFGGLDTANTGATEEYNGSAWTTSNPLNTARFSLAGTGIQTAALAFGGYIDPGSPGVQAATEEYNGTYLDI
jgi:hypothetical protein